MATTGIGFRWLDILEKEFDKACIELDTSITEIETEEPEVVFAARQRIASLGSCFAQLTHKALSIFQNSAKLEAELVDMRAELIQVKAAVNDGREDIGARTNVSDASRTRAEAAQLARENAALRETVLSLHSELFGARLATKYLDKELAGRIQQLQLLGRDMRSEVRDSLWAQVEAEILLQRHKTLVRVCRGLDARRVPRPPAPLAGRARSVRVRRQPSLGLGLSVTGGREHGVPILISELEAGGPAALTGQLYVGDAILAINDIDLTQTCHKEAVKALQSVKGDCVLCVQFIATDDDDRLSEDNYRFPLYPDDEEAFEVEPDGSGATPTAPRTPEYNHRPNSPDGSASESSETRTRNAAAPVRYPLNDFNAANNNLSILDMDDDSIKIEARLQMVPAELSPRASNGPYKAVDSESRSSAASTPVHNTKLRKRLAQDWRSKGLYRAVAAEADASSPAHASPEPEVRGNGLPHEYESPESPPAPCEHAPDIEPRTLNANPPLNKPELTTKPLRRENKGFRIGSAKRITEPALRNGESERSKFPTLLSGDGDPDFGTPV